MAPFIPGGRLDLRAPPTARGVKAGKGLFQPVSVLWAWYNEAAGLVEWTFHNASAAVATVALLRNGYYFGDAFWPVYLANPSFRTVWATALRPLPDQGASQNSPPLVILGVGGSPTVAFAFTLGPGQTWSMLEGGFSPATPPDPQAAPLCAVELEAEFCVGYSPQAVSQWDQQSSTSLQGYSPNPASFRTLELSAPAAPLPTLKLFPVSVRPGPC